MKQIDGIPIGLLDARYQGLDATLTTLSVLADGAGVLTNNGAGVLSWAAVGAGDLYEGGTGGIVGRVAEWVTDDKHLQAANLIAPANLLTITNTAAATLGLGITAGKTLTLSSTDDYTAAFTGATAAVGSGLTLNSAFVGNWINNAAFAVFSHNTVKGTLTSYALMQSSAGITYLNSAAGQALYIRVGNDTIAQAGATDFFVKKTLQVGATYTFTAIGDYAGSGEIPANTSFMATGGGGNMAFVASNAATGALYLIYKTSGGFKSALEIANSAGTTSDLLLMKSGLGTVKIGTPVTIGGGAAGVDYALTFDGETNDGVITWMEDEDYFQFADDVLFGGDAIGFFGITPVARATELTDELTTITHTAPGTPDYAIQDLTATGGYGFVTKDEGNTVLSVIANLQTRVNEMETKLVAYGLLQDAD